MRIEIDDPTMPKGTLFHVNGLGTLENGKTTEFSDEEVKAFEALQGRTVRESFKDNPNVKVVGKSGGDD